jgi:acyl phosphate:glycerol-3-phosphate acyltransferase
VDGWLLPALLLLGSYLLGSIPFGIIVTRLGGAADPRAIGSGNIGATNVLRTGRKELAALTLLLDGGKGAAAVLIAEAVVPGLGPLAGAGGFLGHVFPVWLGFRGGKGVATLLGIALALCWQAGLTALAVWLLATLLTRYSSVGGMSAAIATPVAAAFFFRADLVLLFLGCALVLLWRHRVNIVRLLEGSEPRVGRSQA